MPAFGDVGVIGGGNLQQFDPDCPRGMAVWLAMVAVGDQQVGSLAPGFHGQIVRRCRVT